MKMYVNPGLLPGIESLRKAAENLANCYREDIDADDVLSLLRALLELLEKELCAP